MPSESHLMADLFGQQIELGLEDDDRHDHGKK
jgi:hypothetical protein